MKSKNQIVTKNIAKPIMVGLAVLLLPSITYAASEVSKIINKLCDWLSGDIAGAISVLAVVYSGYEMLQGEIDKMKFMTRCMGIGLVVGGSYITQNYLGIAVS